MPISCPLYLSYNLKKKHIHTKKREQTLLLFLPPPMAAYRSFHQIFENPIQNKTPKSFLDTLSSSSPWNPIPIKGYHVTDHDETPPFTEIFGELHFKESSSTENSSLQLCTEGLGSESYYDLEDGKVNCDGNGEDEIEVKGKEENGSNDEECGPQEKERKEYPPAMTRMSFKTYREEGRLVLEEVRIPRREFLRASREDGRLKLKLVQSDEDEDEKKDKPV
ncbi:protein FAF-like, chloroplastic [Brassica napus]|uniref:protein FAF-like, chloroplastic n=1 Tax=Brassica napus TaxID=3708 RepID=UPI002078A94F|nr:protein FAF-like, chloroplastic [Brassica napus]